MNPAGLGKAMANSAESKPTRIVVKVTPEGNTIIVNEDGTETVTSTVLQHPIQGIIPAISGGSDDVTMAAVKSILQDAGNLQFNIFCNSI